MCLILDVDCGLQAYFNLDMIVLLSYLNPYDEPDFVGMPSVRSEKREVTPPNKWGGGPVSSSSSSSLVSVHASSSPSCPHASPPPGSSSPISHQHIAL